MARRVIIDCDPGTDDAFAIMLFLYGDKIGLLKIEGFVIVTGNTDVENGARNLIRLLEIAERTDIPVYRGSDQNILFSKRAEPYHGDDGFGDLQWNNEPNMCLVKPEFGPVFLGRLITDNPGQISICAQAPLTNLALALKMYPKMAESVKELWIMGGNDTAVGNITAQAEFNFYCDPESVYITLDAMKCPIYILTWECSLKPMIPVCFRFKTLVEAGSGPLLDLLTKIEKAVADIHQSTDWCAPDACMAAAFLYPEKVIRKKVDCWSQIELCGTLTRGQLCLDHLHIKPNNTTIISEIDAEAYKDVCLEAWKGMSGGKKGCQCADNPAGKK